MELAYLAEWFSWLVIPVQRLECLFPGADLRSLLLAGFDKPVDFLLSDGNRGFQVVDGRLDLRYYELLGHSFSPFS